MAVSRSILCFVALLVASASAQAIQSIQVGNFTFDATGNSFTAPFPRFDGSVVDGVASVSITRVTGANVTLNICIQRVLPLPDNAASWSSKSCSVFVQAEIAATNQSVAVAYLDVPSVIGIYLAAGNASSFSVAASADVCPAAHVATPQGVCSPSAALQANVVSMVSADDSAVQLFSMNVAQPDTASLSLTFAVPSSPTAPVAAPVATPIAAPIAPAPTPVVAAPTQSNLAPVEPPVQAPVEPPVQAPVEPAPTSAPASKKRNSLTSVSYTVYVKYASAPSQTQGDDFVFSVNSSGTLQIPAPISGNWFIAVVRSSGFSSTYNLTAAVSACQNSSLSGPDCTADFAPLLGNVSANAAGNAVSRNVTTGLTLFRIARATLSSRLFVGVSGLRPAKFPANVTLYLSVGGAPTTSSYIWAGCDEGPCSVVQVANFSSSFLVQGDVWIGVANANSSEMVIAWRDAPCANNCNNQGTCETDPASEKFGQCSCQNLYEGVDCSVKPTGLPIQVIVLIIIGSLLVLTALVGFIAWIVSRRSQRAGYQQV
eukprot:TRINITY_DN54_c0_g3_i1.p1 TRINITY_DN54_c0_g3~~TRINITY_DN54_c0_g3_i1.p1  ORF type:complete len:559 (-),score=96.00 TRINITY_DN54_c0_g3_i1:1306-2931(-)